MTRIFTARFWTISIASIVLLSASFAEASSHKKKPKKKKQEYFVSAHPLYPAIRGQRVDFEMRIKDTRQWIVLGPQLYMGTIRKRENSILTDEKHKLDGFGLNIEHKFMLDMDSGYFATYVTYGAGYQHFVIGYTAPGWKTIVEDGLTYYRYTEQPEKEKINRFTGMAAVGIQVSVTKYIYADMYTGIGLRRSDIKGTSEDFPDYTGFMNYGYTGMHPVAGIKFGVRF